MAAPGGGRFRERFLVGWFDRSEWREVRQNLYSDDLEKLRHAVGRISVWKSRMVTQLPITVECSFGIVQAVIEDKTAIESSQINEKDLTLRMNYSTALVRFVSLLTEKLQKKSLAQPMHELAQTLGLPFWMVELRHNASHGALPSLQILRSGTQTALEWLKKEYWDVEKMGLVSDEEETVQDREHLTEDTLVAYIQERFESLSDGQNNSNKDQTLMKLNRMSKHDSETFLKCLLKDGYMIPETEQLEALNVDIKRYLEMERLCLPWSMIEMWSFLLPVLNPVMGRLLEMAAIEARDSSPLRRKLLYSLTALVLDSATSQSRNGAMLHFATPPVVDYHKLLDIIVESPNRLNQQLLPLILKNMRPTLPRRNRNDILRLTDLILRKMESKAKVNGKKKRLSSVEGLGQLRRNMEDVLAGLERESKEDKVLEMETDSTMAEATRWCLGAVDLDWSAYAFGTCPHAKITSRNLELQTTDFQSEEAFPRDDASKSPARPVEMTEDVHVEEVLEELIGERNETLSDDWSSATLDKIRGKVTPLRLS